jgi:glutathione S-transferase
MLRALKRSLTMRLHYNAFSSNSRRAMLVAFHLGTKIELVRVDLAARDQRKSEFLRMNPNGKVPVLEDGDFFLWESNAIAEYLCEITSGQSLLPSAAKARADVTRWAYWTSSHLAPSVGILGFENFVKKFVTGGDPDPNEVVRGEKLVSDLVAILDRHLEGREWLAQDRLTLADFAVAATLFARERIKLPAMPARVNAWLARVESLPASKQCERTA